MDSCRSIKKFYSCFRNHLHTRSQHKPFTRWLNKADRHVAQCSNLYDKFDRTSFKNFKKTTSKSLKTFKWILQIWVKFYYCSQSVAEIPNLKSQNIKKNCNISTACTEPLQFTRALSECSETMSSKVSLRILFHERPGHSQGWKGAWVFPPSLTLFCHFLNERISPWPPHKSSSQDRLFL